MSGGASAGEGGIDRSKLGQLPRQVRIRVRDIPRHLRALRLALSRTDAERLAEAMRSGDEEVLLAEVYPIERALTLLDNYVVELAEIALDHVGEPRGSGVENLRRLASIGAVRRARIERLVELHRARNEVEHAYPDVVAPRIFEAADILSANISGFLTDYVRWFIRQLDS